MSELPDRGDVWEWMKERDQWRLWSRETNPQKIPLDERGSGEGWNDPGCWLSFDEAYQLAEEEDRFDGIGFVVSSADPFYGIDADSALREPNVEKPKDWVPSLDLFADETAIQFSTSGTGFHVFGTGDIPDWWKDSAFRDRDHEGIEAYDEKFFIITGRELSVSAGEPGGVDPMPFLADAWREIRGETPPPFQEPEKRDRDTSNGDNEVYDAVDALYPADVGLRSEYVEDENSDVESWNPAYRQSESGISLKRWKSNGVFVDMEESEEGFGVLDLLAAEEGIIHAPYDRLAGSDWKEAYELARDRCDELPPLDAGGSQNTKQQGAATDGGATAAAGGSAATDDSPPPLAPPGVMQKAFADPYGRLERDPDARDPTVHDLRNAEAATYVWDVLEDRDDRDVMAVSDGTFRAFERGVWRQEGGAGEQRLREYGSKALRSFYSTNVLEQLKEETATRNKYHVDELGIDEPWIVAGEKALNLNTRETRSVERDDLAIRRIDAEFDADAEPDLWLDFLSRVAASPETIQKLQEYFGYTLWLHGQPFGKGLFLVGDTDSGKGTALKTLSSILGPEENVANETLKNLIGSRWGKAQLYGRIVNIRNEVTPGGLQNVQEFKELLGGADTVTAERKGKEKFRFTVTQKFIFATNQFPDVENADDAFWNRCLFARFPETIPQEEQRPEFHDELLAERSGILNWMLDGLDRLFEQGGFTGERTLDEKRNIAEEVGSPLERLKQEALTITREPTDLVHARDLYDLATAYAEEEGIGGGVPSWQGGAFTSSIRAWPGVESGRSRRFDDSGDDPVFKGVRVDAGVAKRLNIEVRTIDETPNGQTGLDV
jgi:P4 family phage/plasmid primase-like protien